MLKIINAFKAAASKMLKNMARDHRLVCLLEVPKYYYQLVEAVDSSISLIVIQYCLRLIIFIKICCMTICRVLRSTTAVFYFGTKLTMVRYQALMSVLKDFYLTT